MRFRNLDERPVTRGLGQLLKWKLGLGERHPRTPARAAVPVVPNDGAALTGATRPALTWVGHATYLVQLDGLSMLTDPILSPRIALIPRNVPPGLGYEALPRLDLVLISHNHLDHLDAPTIRRLGPEPTYVVPAGLGAWFRRASRPVVELEWWQSHRLGDVEVTLVPAQHWSRRGLFDEDQSLWGGYLIRGRTQTVYHSGDTAYFSGFAEIGRRLGPIHAALLPIGAYEPRWFMAGQHMNPGDATQAFLDLGAERFVAMHWGTFKLTDEALDEPPRALDLAWAEAGLDRRRLHVPAIGETLWLDDWPSLAHV